MRVKQVEVAYRSRRPGDYPSEWIPEVAFLGRSNVGKSSVINALLSRRRLAPTSRDPGRTRAIHWYRLVGDGRRCYFVDLPGYGYAKVSRRIRQELWGELIETYLTSGRPLVLAVQLLDIRRRGPTELDELMIEWLRQAHAPHVFVLTKCDKLGRGRRHEAVRRFAEALDVDDGLRPVPFSAVTGEGKRELWSLIDDRLAQAA